MSPDASPGLLAAVVRASASPTSVDGWLDDVARLLLARADWVVVDRLEEPDLIVRVAGHTKAGPIPMPGGASDLPVRRSSAGALGLLPRVLRAPQQMLRLDRAALEALTQAPQTYEAQQAKGVLALDTQELLVVAVTRREHVLAVLSLGRTDEAFSAADVDELTAVVAHLAVALYAARLHATQSAVATALQTYLLPAVPVVAGLRLAARYAPAARGIDVGGDWYDAFVTARGLAIVIGDTAGHDVIAAVRMAELRNLLRAYAVDRDEAPSQLLSRLDRAGFALQLEIMATCLVGHLEPLRSGTWRLTWSSAGHLPPVRVRAGQAQLLETPADLMLGVDRDTPRRDHVVELSPGDLLVLITDGLIERPGLGLDERLELLRAAAAECHDRTPDESCDDLLARFGADAVDDVALLVVGVEPPPPGD